MIKNILKKIIQDQRTLSKCIREGKDLNEIIKERGIIITKISKSTTPKKLNIPKDIIEAPVESYLTDYQWEVIIEKREERIKSIECFSDYHNEVADKDLDHE